MGRQWGPGAFSRCHAALPLPLPLRLLRLRPPLRRGRRRARPVRRRPADRRVRRRRGGGRPLGRARLARPRRPPWRRRVDPQGQLPRRTLELSPTLLLTCAGLPLPSSAILTDVWLLFVGSRLPPFPSADGVPRRQLRGSLPLFSPLTGNRPTSLVWALLRLILIGRAAVSSRLP